MATPIKKPVKGKTGRIMLTIGHEGGEKRRPHSIISGGEKKGKREDTRCPRTVPRRKRETPCRKWHARSEKRAHSPSSERRKGREGGDATSAAKNYKEGGKGSRLLPSIEGKRREKRPVSLFEPRRKGGKGGEGGGGAMTRYVAQTRGKKGKRSRIVDDQEGGKKKEKRRQQHNFMKEKKKKKKKKGEQPWSSKRILRKRGNVPIAEARKGGKKKKKRGEKKKLAHHIKIGEAHLRKGGNPLSRKEGKKRGGGSAKKRVTNDPH